ncbi:hypothetical protein [Jeotgalibaca caeni]|uniref:hypothetical protein n=1 Tax=Jeotgalibaca caeni TaxID=3028623 RepID=UPI00237D38CC|nr:hypothetical protein [Jeotgalibaca caeni]MDE1548678.1 hypothetical protein [Jeotgalibaca caeni]
MDVSVVFQQMIILMLMVVIGYVAASARIFEQHSSINFATLINYITIPAMVIGSTGSAGAAGSKADSLLV